MKPLAQSGHAVDGSGHYHVSAMQLLLWVRGGQSAPLENTVSEGVAGWVVPWAWVPCEQNAVGQRSRVRWRRTQR